MKTKILCTLLLLLLLLGGGAYFARTSLIRWSHAPRTLSEPVEIDFPRGTSLKVLSEELTRQGVISRSEYFLIWARLFSKYARFQAGRYRFEGSVSPRDVANMIISGEVYRPIVLQYSIPEGFTYRQFVERLLARGVGTAADFERLNSDPEFLASLNIPSTSLEGYLYPATYQFTELPSPEQLIRKAVDVFWSRLPSDYLSRIANKGITLNDAVIIASLIELETSHDDERAKVAEVILRRLNAGVALAIDASVIYGIEKYAGNLTFKHLRDQSNPYNTRVHKGLPPTPIGSPSAESLEAVLNPTNDGMYYYVLDLETGRHQFSKSLKEHNTYVRKLVRETRKRRLAEKENTSNVSSLRSRDPETTLE